MTTLLTSISGQFGKSVILGILFPVLLVSILTELIVGPIMPFGAAIQNQLKQIATGDDKWAAVALVFVVLVLTGILYNLNIPVIRVYEGYPWKDSYLGNLFARSKKKQFNKAVPLRLALRYLRRDLLKLSIGGDLPKSLQLEQNALALYINTELPDREEFILPTRLGNVIRCFERYSFIAYGMDAIVLWPRLVAKIDAGFASTIDDTKTSLDFMVNSSFLCGVSSLAVLIIGLLTRTPFTVLSVFHWLWRMIVFLALSVLFYVFSIGRAKAWGMQVKAAFDLYRFDLLKALGYLQPPVTFLEEKTLWLRISSQLLYADSRERPIPYNNNPTRLTASPVGVQLEIKRQVNAAAISGNVAVEISVKNKDTRTADVVVLSDNIPDGFKCLVNSVRVSAGVVSVSSLVPLEMVTGMIGPGTTVSLTYVIKPSSA